MKRWLKITIAAHLAIFVAISMAVVCSTAAEENVRDTRDIGSTDITPITDLNGHVRFRFIKGEYEVTGAWSNQLIFRDNPFSVNGEDAFTGLSTILTNGVTVVQAVRSNGSKMDLVDGDILQFLNKWDYLSDTFSDRVALCITSTFKNMPNWTADMSNPYQMVYSTLSHYLFGDDFTNVPFGDWWITGLSALICITLALAPFIILWVVLKMLMR